MLDKGHFITVIKEYEININKEMADTTVVIASDLHLSTAVGQEDLDYFADRIEEMNPDMVFLVGDVYDESSKDDDVQYSFEVFKRIAKKYPVYYVEGNHELGYNQVGPLQKYDLVNNLTKIGVSVLQDEVVELEDMYIIGRLDFSNSERMDMDTLMKGVDTNKAIILLDHQPKELQQNSERGVDFQVSGHTHGGQMFPIGQIDNLFRINEMNYGIRQIDDYHIVVTSGMGMWGYDMRTTGQSEILKIQFTGK